MLHMFFRLMELECSLISHGSEAISTLRRLRPDVLILDLDLPDLRALDIAFEIRALVPRLPIIFLSDRTDSPAVPFGAPLLRKPHGKFEEMLRLFEAVLATEE
jgi:two-component system, OmpR family, response regulator MtrA